VKNKNPLSEKNHDKSRSKSLQIKVGLLNYVPKGNSTLSKNQVKISYYRGFFVSPEIN